MTWNWELAEWPYFSYNEDSLKKANQEFIQGAGGLIGVLKYFDEKEKKSFIVEILSLEGSKSSAIEGEILDRESLQSSICKNFHLKADTKKHSFKEKGIADLMCSVYESFEESLSHEMLWGWFSMLFNEPEGAYRSHEDPMQIVSHRLGDTKVFFEAPPSTQVFKEMDCFIEWFNNSRKLLSPIARAAIAHIYFESIHPFEDGNGRIGRALSEKALSQAIGHPTLTSISNIIDTCKKSYYRELGFCNHTLEVDSWVHFFSEIILKAQSESIQLLEFLIFKSKLMHALEGQINPRQEKVLIRLFEAGPKGFQGGLSAENYIAITKASRATTTRDLADLVSKGALIKTGERRHTRYWLKKSPFS